MAQEGAGGDTSLAPGLLPAQGSRRDISLQPWRDVLQEGHLEGELRPCFHTRMRWERGARLPDPLSAARAARRSYSPNPGADTGAILLGLQGKALHVCCVQHLRQILVRWPLAAVTLSRQLCPPVPLRRGCSRTASPAVPRLCDIWLCGFCLALPVPKSILTFFSKVQRPHCSRYLESVCENGCAGGCSSPKICAFKLSEGITDISLLCFWVLLVSFSKYPPATWGANAQPRSLEMSLGTLPATTAGGH